MSWTTMSFIRNYGDSLQALYAKLLEVYQKNAGELLDRDAQIASLENDLKDLRLEKAELAKRMEELVEDRHLYASQLAKMLVQGSASGTQEATPEATSTHAPVPVARTTT